MTRQPGLFITVEGVEGAGKSSHLETLKAWLERRKVRCRITREPGGTALAEKIRSLVLDLAASGPLHTGAGENLTRMAELLLIFAARAQHLETLIEPTLASGCWVLCDRFTDSTYAYQGGGRGLQREQIAALETLVQGTLRPDLTIILDVDPELGLQRINQRGAPDRFEREPAAFFRKVRQAYLDIAKNDPGRCVIVDANQELADVQAELLHKLAGKLDGA